MNANKSGKILETTVHKILESYKGIMIQPQYPLQDIYGDSKVDFKILFNNRIYFIEVKNQGVRGSVDQKLPYYIENIRHNKYNGHFIFILNLTGIRDSALTYLSNQQKNYDFSVIDSKYLKESFDNIFLNGSRILIKKRISPCLKWAGGKRSIMKDIIKYFPNKISGNYFEPFAGSLSVLFHIYNENILSENSKIFVNDNLYPLVNLYDKIKSKPEDLLSELEKEKYVCNKENFENNKKRFNEIKDRLCTESAALFLFLNKSGFNGLYRENKEGIYNVPFCKKEAVKIYDKDNILSLSDFFKKVEINCLDYTCIFDYVKEGDFVYLDPPYYNTFSQYSSSVFSKQDHIKLKEFSEYLVRVKKATVFISNSDEEFIKNLYREHDIIEIPVKRILNSKASERSKEIKELLIKIGV